MVDYFAFMDLPRQLALDEGELERRYYALSRKYHPDFHTQSSDEERQQSLEQSSVLNQAYKTLKEQFARARYLVDLEWPDLPDAEKKSIPPILLMEVMEMQEKIAEARFEEDDTRREQHRRELQEVETRLRGTMDGLRGDLDRIAAAWDTLPPGASNDEKRPLLKELNQILNTRNYIRTLLSTIDAAIHGGPGVMH